MKRKKRVLLAFDMGSKPPEDHNYRSFIGNQDWDCEFYIDKALTNLGYEVQLRGLYDDLPGFLENLKELKPHIVFNMLGTFKNSRAHEPSLAGILEMLDIPYTGSKSMALAICQDKVLTKKILRHHRIRVADWITSFRSKPLTRIKGFKFPAFVKGVSTEGSEGISKDSFVENEKDCLERIHFLHEKFNTDVIVEEFIPGREIYAAVMGSKQKTLYPLRELKIFNQDDDEPLFATYRAKWDEKYRKKWRVQNRFAKGLEPEIEKKMERIVKRAFSVLQLHAYARFDLRLTPEGEIVVLEANPNPSIATYDDFSQSVIRAGVSYEEMLEKIIRMA